MLERGDCKECCRSATSYIPVVAEGCERGLRLAENDGVLGLQVKLYWYNTLGVNI